MKKSGLKNTGELSNALFSGGLACYCFTQHSRLTMPVLVIGGRHDGAIGMAPLRELAAKLPHATLSEYEQSAHFPYSWNNRIDSLRRSLAFLPRRKNQALRISAIRTIVKTEARGHSGRQLVGRN